MHESILGCLFTPLLVMTSACHGSDPMTSDDEGEPTAGSDGAAACGDERRPADAIDGEVAALSLVDHELWQQVGDSEDPMAAHRPEAIDCGPLGWEVEFDGFEVVTIGCNYMAATQPTLVDLCAGDTIHFDFQHFNLVADGPAQAHAAVLVGDQPLLDYTVDIGSETATPARKWDELIEIEDTLPAGTPVYLHIHNHGFNTYKLLKIELLLPPED